LGLEGRAWRGIGVWEGGRGEGGRGMWRGSGLGDFVGGRRLRFRSKVEERGGGGAVPGEVAMVEGNLVRWVEEEDGKDDNNVRRGRESRIVGNSTELGIAVPIPLLFKLKCKSCSSKSDGGVMLQ
jgi:hypothetical protein